MIRLLQSHVFLILCFQAVQVLSGKEESSHNLRASIAGSVNSTEFPQFRRQSVVRRLYGPENAHVRRNVREVEERPQRSKTGLLGDPTHRVPYENHPYDKSNHQRNLQEAEDIFRPMRIKFFTEELDSLRTAENAAKIDFIESEILPRTAEFWSQAISVVPVSGNLKIATSELDGREFCGDSEFTRVPDDHISTGLSNTDLVLYVSGAPSTRFCSGTTLAVAVSCNFDQYDRPTAGAINICLDQIELDSDGTASAAIIDDNVDVLVSQKLSAGERRSGSCDYVLSTSVPDNL